MLFNPSRIHIGNSAEQHRQLQRLFTRTKGQSVTSERARIDDVFCTRDADYFLCRLDFS